MAQCWSLGEGRHEYVTLCIYAFVCLGIWKTHSDWMEWNLPLSFVGSSIGWAFQRTAAVLELFALAGSLTYGVLADKYSRRTTFVTACGKYLSSMGRRNINVLILDPHGIKPPISRFLRRVSFAMWRSQVQRPCDRKSDRGFRRWCLEVSRRHLTFLNSLRTATRLVSHFGPFRPGWTANPSKGKAAGVVANSLNRNGLSGGRPSRNRH